MDPATPRAKPRRGIYLLPNLITSAALLAGYYAIVSAIGGRYTTAAIAVFVAGVLDGMDGRIARLTNTQSEFGVQYDSLSDLVSFGLAPALVMYTWALSTLGDYGPIMAKVGWAASFLYAACAALRLARFNAQVGQVDKRYFIGLASPAAAGLLMSFVWACREYGLDGRDVALVALAVTLAGAGLMVSRVRFVSFKGGGPDSDRVPFLAILVAILVFVAIAVLRAYALLAIAFSYAASGPLMALFRRRRNEPAAPAG